MLFSKTTGGFYDRDIHGNNIPDDAVEITAEQHAELLHGQSQGKVIVAGKDGKPELQDPAPPSDEELLAIKHAEAKKYLSSTDWYFARLAETGAPVPEEVLTKRKEAREALQ